MTAWPAPPLDPAAERQIVEIGGADIVIGIPSFNNGETIGHVARAALAGLARHFPGQRCVLVNSDGGSSDGTRDAVHAATLDDPRAMLVRHPVSPATKLVTPYNGLPGKGSAFRTIFHIAAKLGARACAVVDADLRSVTPDWFAHLLTPVLENGVDYVAPLYLRHKFDGTITNSVVYPITRALYGSRLRQPIGGDFGFSQALARHWLAQDVWDTDVARFGIDIWMTTTAVAGGFKTAQAFLGAKIHDPKDPGQHLSGMMIQVVGTVFRLMETYEDLWKDPPLDREVPLYGFPYAVGLEPVRVSVGGMVSLFRQGVADLGGLYDTALAPDTAKQVRALAAQGGESAPVIDDVTWCHIVYDFAVAHHHRLVQRELLLQALTPLYLGRVASFVEKHVDSDPAAVEDAIEQLCHTFQAERPFLRSRWEKASPQREDTR